MTIDPTVEDEPIDSLERKRSLEAAIRTRREAVLVVNSRSRRGRQLYRRAKRLLRERGIALALTYPVRNPARVPEIVRNAIGKGYQFIIVGGGDGTISSVVDFFAYRSVVLGILPAGTANSYARALGIPLALNEAVEVVVSGKVVDVNLGKINGNHFANAAAIGLPASIARHMPKLLKRWFGRVGYLLVAAVRLVRQRPFRCTLTASGRTIEFDAMEVRVANGQYQGGVRVANEASLESRDLVIQSIKGGSRWSIVRFWTMAMLGYPPSIDDVLVVKAPDVTLDTAPRQYVSIDGEPVTQTPIRATVARNALMVVAPRERTDLV